MKMRRLFGVLLAAVAVVACDPDDVVVTPELSVDKDAVSLTADDVEASFSVTSNVDWTVSHDADWVVSVNPSGGKASDEPVTVNVVLEANESQTERTASVTVTAGDVKKTVTLTQAGAVINYIDGYQWLAEFDDRQVLFDFGVAEEDMLCIAMPLMDGTGFGLYMAGLYEVERQDNKSGTVSFTQYDWEWDEYLDECEFQYSDLTATSVRLVCEMVFGVSDPITFTRVDEPYEIVVDGEDDPVGTIENGDYWFLNGTKVMAPLPEGEMSGLLPASDAADGKGTEGNLFTLTYDPDVSGYTIQDAYGRYLGNEGEDEVITLTDELPSGEDYGLYIWVVYDGNYDDGTHDVYNSVTYNGFAYKAEEGVWCADPSSYETDGVRPVLVRAE